MSDKVAVQLDVDIDVHDEDQLIKLRKEWAALAKEITNVGLGLRSFVGSAGGMAKAAGAVRQVRAEIHDGEAKTFAALKRRFAFERRMSRQKESERVNDAREARQESAEAAKRLRDALAFSSKMTAARERSARQEASAVARAAKEEARAKASSAREATRMAERAAQTRARAEAEAERQVRAEIRETARLRAREQREAERRQRAHERNLERASRGVGRIHDGAGRVAGYGAAGAATAGYAASRAIGRGVSTRMEIDSAETAIKMFNDTDDGKGGKRAITSADIRALRRGPRGLDAEAIRNGTSVAAALQAYNEIAKAGLADPMEQTRTLLSATTALELDPRATTKLMGTMARNMGAAATPARLKKTLNALAIAAREDPTQSNEIVEGMNRAQSVLAMSSGVTEEDLAAMVSGGISSGIHPGKAGTYLSALAKSISEGNSKFLDPKKRKELNFAARNLGFGSAKDMATQFAGEKGKDVIYQIFEKLKGMSPQMRAQVADALSGGQWSDEDLQMVNGLEGMKATDKAINNPKNANFLDDARNKKMQSWKGLWDQSRAIFSLFWESFGVGFDKILRDINAFFLDLHGRFNYDAVSNIVKDAVDGLRHGLGFKSWREALESIFPADVASMGPSIRLFFTGFGSGLRSVANVIHSIASFFSGGGGAEAIGNLAGKFLLLSVAAAALSPVIGVIAGLSGIIAGIAGVARAAAGAFGVAGAGAGGAAAGAAGAAGVWATVGGMIAVGFLAKLANAFNVLKSDDKKGLFGNLLEELIPAPLRRFLDTGSFSTTPPDKNAPWVDPPKREDSPADKLKGAIKENTEALKADTQATADQTKEQAKATAEKIAEATKLNGKAFHDKVRELGDAVRAPTQEAARAATELPSGTVGAGSGLGTMPRSGIIGRDGSGSGSRSFRNSNPGNLKDGPFARKNGAIGRDKDGFAVFPDEATGRKAQEALLFGSDSYRNLSIRDAIKRYAPGSDGNNPAGYAAEMARAAGVGVDTRMSDLTPDQRARFLDAQKLKEGWKTGSSGSSVATGTGGNPVDVAKTFIGMGEHNSGRAALEKFTGGNIVGAASAWCSRFVNASLAAVGERGTGSAVASSFLKWGRAISADMVQKGDVLVDHRGRSAGATGAHVGLATGNRRMGRNGELELEMISGNSRDQVRTTWERASKLAARRGAEYKEKAEGVATAAKADSEGWQDIADGMRRTPWVKKPASSCGSRVDDLVGRPGQATGSDITAEMPFRKLGTDAPIRTAPVPMGGRGGGAGGPAVNVTQHIHGAGQSPEELANTVNRRLNDEMRRRSHDVDVGWG